MFTKYRILLVLVCICSLLLIGSSLGLSAPETESSSSYLSGYESADPRPSAISWWSTFAYLLSLFAVFAFVAVMAYFVSKFLSNRFSETPAGSGGKVLAQLPLGPNRSVCVVELADRVFMLGVTEQSITLLREITDEDEIDRLHRRMLGGAATDTVLSRQLRSIEQLTRRLPSVFRDGKYHK